MLCQHHWILLSPAENGKNEPKTDKRQESEGSCVTVCTIKVVVAAWATLLLRSPSLFVELWTLSD